MELVQDNSLPYVKGKSLCTASFQNKSKPLATVELVCFGPQLFPFLIDPILNMTTRIDMEKAGRKLPNPIFENVVYQQSSAVIHDKVEYGYCEIRGVEDGDLNIKKTAEFLLQQKWVGVVHMSDSSKLYIVPSSDLSQRLGLTDTNYLHGLFARKLPNQADSSVQLSDNLPNNKSKKCSKIMFVNLTTDTDDDCKIVEPPPVQKIRTTSPRNSSCLSPGDPQPVAETSHHVDVFANQTVLKSCKKKQNSRTESPLVHGSTVDHVAKPYYGKFSFKKVKTRTEPVFTEQACSTPTNTQSPTMKPNLQNSCRTRMQDTGVTVVGTSVSSCNDSPGILKTSSICGIETQSVGARDAPNTSSVCGTSVSLIGAEDSQNTSSADMSTLSAGVGESGNTSSSTTISLAGIREPLNTIAYASSVGGTVVPALNEGTPGNQLALVTVTGKGGCGGKEKGRGKGAQIETVSLDAEGQGKMLTRKRGKESRNANSTSNSETEPTVKKKKLVGKPAEEGRDVFICVKVLSEVLLKDQVDVIPDILKLEAEVIPILQEELPMTELPMTVSGTSVDNVVSLLSKKPKKSCLSKPRTCSVSRSPSTPTENTVPPMGSGEVTSMVSSTSQKQSFDEGAMGEAATVEDEVTFHLTQLHTETDDILDNGSLTLKTPKKVSLAEYKSRRRPTLDSAVRGKDSIQTSPAMLDTEKECSPKGIMDIMSPVNAGSPRMQLGDNPAHHMFNIAPVSAISVTNHGVAASVFTQAPVSSQTIPFSSTPILPISSAPQDQLLDGARQDAGLAMPQENSEPPSIVLSSLPSSTDSIPSSLPAGSILSGSSIEQTAKLAILQNSQVVPESAVPHIRVSKVQTVSYREDVSKTGSTVPGSSVGTVSNPVPAVAGMSSTGAHVLEATLHTMPPFTLRDLLINQYSDHSTPTSSPCPHPQNEYLLQNPPPFSPVVPPLRDLSSGSNSSQSKSTDHIVDVSLQNFSATGPSTIATQQGGSIVSHKQSVSSRDCSFRRYSSTPPALLPVTSETVTRSTLSMTSPLHSTAESMLLDPPADLQSPLPMSLVCDSPSFHLVCTSSPQTNSSKVDNTIDVSRSPELALELMLSPSSDHPADSTILAEQQTSSSPFSTPVRSTFPVLSSSTSVPLHKDHSNAVVVNSESTPLRPNVELNTYVPQVSSHQGINDGSSSSTRNAEKSSPKISSTAIPSAHNCPVSIQNSVGGIFRVPYSVCQPSPISQTPAFYLPTCNYYPYVLPCVPPVSSNIPFAYPWTTPYGSVYQHYAVPSTLSSPSPPTQPQAWIVAQHALVSQHLEAQPKQQAKSPKLPKGVAEREQHTGVLLATDVDSSRTSAASLDDQCKSSHKSTQTDHLLDITTSSVVAASDAAVQTVCGMEMGTQTDLGEFFGSVTCSNKSVDEAVWKARQWLVHEIKYNTMDEMETEGDIENSQGSLPSPVISGASNISDGDLMSNSANSDGVSSPSKEDVAISQCFSYNSPESLQRCSPNMRHDPPPLLEFQSHTMGSEAHLPYSTPPYTLYSTPPYTSYSTPPYTSYTTPPYTSYSTPPCPSHTTSQPYPSDSTPPCPPDSTPPPCPSDSTPPSSPAAQYSPYSTPPYLSCPTPPYPSCSISPHASYPTTQVCDSTPSSYPLDLPCPPDSTPPHCPPDSTPPHCPPDSTPPHCLPVSTSPHCLPDSTPPHCLPDCTPPYCLPDCTPPHCLPDSTPPHCLPDSTPPHCLPDATPPHCLPDSTPPHCLPDSTPPHFLPYSTLPHCPPDSTCPCGPPDSTPPHCSHDSLSPHCPHDSTPPHCPLDSSPPHCPLGGSSQPLEPTFVPSSDSTNVAGGSTQVQVFVHSDLFIYCATSVASVAIDSDACHVTAKNSSVNDTSITLGTVCTSHFGSESEENATAKVPCLTGPNESNYSLLCDTLSFQAQSLTEEHVAAQEEQLVNFPSGVNHIRAVSLPPLSSRSSNSSGSPNSSSLFEEEPVFTFSTKLSGRAASLSSSGFGDPPSTGKPKITMSAAEILQKVRAKRSSQPSLPSLQEQQHEQLSIHPSHFPQESPSQENEVDATVGSSSRGEGRGIDLDQLMMKFQNHMKTKQKRKKKDKSWRHISNMDIGSHSLGWYGVYPVPSMIVPLPSHPFLGCRYNLIPDTALPMPPVASPETALPLSSVANPETALPLPPVASPETALPLSSVANPETALPLPPVANSETALPLSSVANPETALPLSSVANPETALPLLSVANPDTALSVPSVVNPETALSMSSVANPETVLSVSSVVNPETALFVSSVANPETALFVSSVANPKTALSVSSVANPETALSVSSVVNPETSLPLSSVANPGLSSVANPETALPMLPVGNNNKNNLKEHLMPTDSHNNIDVQPSVNSLESTSSVQCSEYFAATISIPCYQELPSQEAPSIENMVMYSLSPPASQQLPSVSGVPIISETPVETTHSISEDICICSGDKQQITTEGSIQLNEQCFSSSFDLPCSTNQYVSQHLSSTNQHLLFIHNAGGGGESLGKEKVIMEIEAISDDDGDDTGHSRCTSSHIPAIFDLTNNGKTSPSGLCGNRVMCDDYEHVDMVTSPVGSNSPDNSINALTCNAGINKGFSDIYLAPTHEHSCLSPHNHISDDKECIGNERVPSVEIGRLNKALEAVIEGTDDEARTHIGCMEVVEPTALQVGNRSSTTNTANIKKNDEQFGNAASVSAEQHNDMSNNGIVSEAVASERLGGTVSSKMSIDKPLLMSPNHEPPRDPTLDCIVGNFRSREQGSNACDRNTENFHPYIIDLCEDDSYHPNRERPLNHVSWSEKHSPQRERQQTSPVWRSSAQSQKTGQKVDGMRSSSFQWRGDVNENRPAQCSSNSAGLQPLMNLPLSPDTIPQNGQNIATFLRGTNLPASARASIYNQYSSCTMPPHSMWQLQDLSRRDHVMINQYPGHAHNWQDHPSILQTPEGTSQLPPPLFSAPHHPLMEGRGGSWSGSDRARHSNVHLLDGRLQRSSYDSGENFTVNNAFDTFGNPRGPYHSQGRYPRSRFYKGS